MSKQQFISGSIGKKSSQSQPENPLFFTTKQQIFSAHFSKLNRSREEIGKQSAITLSSQYQRTFEQYTKSTSLIDTIAETFDNGNIADLFQERPKFAQSQVFIHLQPKSRETVRQINQLFFNHSKKDVYEYAEPLTCQNYSKILVYLNQKPLQFEIIKQIKVHSQADHPKIAVARSQTVATHNPIDSKVDLLLNEIFFQKKRSDCPLYFQAMQIKLMEFIDYVIGDDDRYIGLSLKDKAQQIIKEINTFKGKTLDGWLILVLIEIFFQEFNELQTLKVSMLRMQRQSEESKHEIRSQMDAKSQKSNNSSIKKGKYSQPNSHRNNIKEDEWIGALK